MSNNNWTKNQLIVAFNLYCKTPFTKINSSNKDVRELAPIIGRTAGALAMKLANFARLDPDLQSRGIKGLRGGAKGEEEVWNEFENNWEQLAFESEKILADYKGITIESQIEKIPEDRWLEGKEREATVRLRVNQNFFRKSVLASYNNKCCITGIAIPELLVAGHIIPWAQDLKNRMNPSNGLSINAIHDRAFDKGLLTITPDYIIKISDRILDGLKTNECQTFFLPYAGKKISMPQKFFPQKEFLEYHSTQIYRL